MTIASSAEVYGESYGEHDEQSPVKPQSPYAASKVSAEALCTSYYYTYGTDVRIVRNFNTFGPRQRSSGYGSVIAIFVKRALEGKPLIVYGDGQQTRDYQYIDDVINGYLISESIPKGEIVAKGKSVVDELKKLRSNVDKIKKYGHINQLSLEEGLKKYINWVIKYDPDSLGVMK